VDVKEILDETLQNERCYICQKPLVIINHSSHPLLQHYCVKHALEKNRMKRKLELLEGDSNGLE